MKKLLIALMVVVCLGVSIKLFAGAGNQFNWGTQYGSSWQTPDDSKTTAGQVLQIGSQGGAVVVAGTTPLTLFSASSTTILALTPSATGQLVFMNAGATQSICISTGISLNQWALLASTNSVCK